MRTNLYLPLLAVVTLLTVVGCATDTDDRPVPGTLQSTDTKNPANENNTPQTNPNPNPEPESNPPGPASDYRPVPASQ